MKDEKKGVKKKTSLITVFEKFPRFFTILFSGYMIVTLLLNVIFNNRINSYYRPNYLNIPNGIWLVCAMVVLIFVLWIMKFCDKKIYLSEKQFYKIVIINFVIIYFIQLFISDNIYFKTGWDVWTLTSNAENIALNGVSGVEADYFSFYPNNVFSVYTLVLFYKIAVIIHKQNPYVVVVAINNLLVNLSVLLAILSIYKITKRQAAAMMSMLFGVILIVLSPWIVIPYTDTLGMIFPISAVFFYVYLKNKYLRYFLFSVLCGIGYLFKPTVIIGLIALIILNTFSVLKQLLCHRLKLIILLKTTLCILIAGVLVIVLDKTVLEMNKTTLDRNKAMTMTHYFMMGLNEKTEGVYSDDDVLYSRSFDNKDARQEGNIKVIRQRYREMGISGYIMHLVKKNIANYNDGTFAWYREGHFFMEMPKKNNLAATLLRRFYWWDQAGDKNVYQIFASIEQIVWFFILLCIVCCMIPGSKTNDVENLIALTLIGVSLFLLLFECRARYLYIFSPLYLVLGGIGLNKINPNHPSNG